MKILVGLIFVINMNQCWSPQNNLNQQNMERRDEIIEQHGPKPISGQTDSLNYDMVISETAVGYHQGISIAVGAFYFKNKNASEGVIVELDINKDRFEEVQIGSKFALNESIMLEVVNIEKGENNKKGKIYLKAAK